MTRAYSANRFWLWLVRHFPRRTETAHPVKRGVLNLASELCFTWRRPIGNHRHILINGVQGGSSLENTAAVMNVEYQLSS